MTTGDSWTGNVHARRGNRRRKPRSSGGLSTRRSRRASLSNIAVDAIRRRPHASRSGHGAGGRQNDAILRAVGGGLRPTASRPSDSNFPYRELGRRAPGSRRSPKDAYRDVEHRCGATVGPCSRRESSADGSRRTSCPTDSSRTLIFLSYRSTLRGSQNAFANAHLRAIAVPMLSVRNEGPVRHARTARSGSSHRCHGRTYRIEGGDHSLRVRGRSQDEYVVELIDAITAFVT